MRYSAELCKEMKERLEGVREEIRRSLENLCDDCFGVQFLDDFSDDIERTLDRVKVEEAGNATQA